MSAANCRGHELVRRWRGSAAALLALVAVGAPVAHAAFVDVTADQLVDLLDGSGGCWIDYDEDGDYDLYVPGGNDGPSRLFLNDPGSGFGEATLDGGRSALADSTILGAAWADIDEDGDLDVCFSRTGGQAHLLRNDGVDFQDVTPSSFSVLAVPEGVAWLDHDRDGDLDVVICDVENGAHLFRNDGDFAFTDLVTFRTAHSAIAGDFTNDGWSDLYVVGPGQQLYLNDGSGAFTPGNSWIDGTVYGTDVGDYDRDGNLDLIDVTAFTSSLSSFVHVGDGSGGTTILYPWVVPIDADEFSVAWGDYDNDGDLDVWRSETGLWRHTDTDSLESIGLPRPAARGANPPVKGVVWVDYDDDGDLDLFAAGSVASGAPSRLYRNDEETGNHALKVRLSGGVYSNIDGIGARVSVWSGGIEMIRELRAGGAGWLNQTPGELHFGLGTATTADSVLVRWPSGLIQRAFGSSSGTVTFSEPEPELTTVPYPPGTGPDLTLDVGSDGQSVINDDSGASTLYYRNAATKGDFETSNLTEVGSDLIQGPVLDAFATANGLEYYFELAIVDAIGSPLRTLTFPESAPAEPGFLPADLGVLAMPQNLVPDSLQYVMFGLPFEPTSADPESVLVDDLGEYDTTLWRFGRYDPSRQVTDELGATGPFSAGAGFWLVMREPVAVGAAGLSRDTRAGIDIEIRPGWNQVATPYLFSVDLDSVDVSAAPDVETVLHEYVVGEAGGGYVPVGEFEPWKAYFVFNAGTSTQPIHVRGGFDPGAGASPRAAAAPAASADGWQITVAAEQGRWHDRANALGRAAAATRGQDRLDVHEPPGLPGMLRVFFERTGDDKIVHELSRDTRGDFEAGETWTLVVEAPSAGTVGLSFHGLEEARRTWGVAPLLLVEESLAVVDLAGRARLELPGERTHRFRLIAGSESYVEDVMAGRIDPPSGVALGRASPNPFTARTRIGFTLPSAQPAELSVFDVQGRRVRMLVKGESSAGLHVVTWNARDEGGSRVAPGVYFYRLHTREGSRTRRIVLVR